MDLPKTAEQFVAFMEEVWSGTCHPNGDGGVILRGSPLYADYHDAISTARTCGMVRTGGSKLDGADCDVYRFPNAADGVLIARDGNAVRLASRRFGLRRVRGSPATLR